MARRHHRRSEGRIAWALVLAQALVACQSTTDVYAGRFDEEDEAESESDSIPPRAEAESTDSEGGGDGAPDADGDDGSMPSSPQFDVGADVVPVDPPPACQTVDLLFVIDNSGSMGDEQLNLVASFPGFIEGITNRLGPKTSYHVGVVTTDAYEWDVPECQAIGGLTVRTGGDLSSAESCGPYAAGGNFMTIDDDLGPAFECAARVGIDGAGIERPMDALTAALAQPAGPTSACNAGFLRDDSLLVVVLITDEEDDGDSFGQPIDWYQSVLDAKHGDQESIVVLSLIGHDKPNECIPSQWTGMMGAEISPRLITFTEQFSHGTVGDVCAPDYGPFFEEAVDGIVKACGSVATPAD